MIATHYFSLDPGMRGRLSGDSYAAGLKLGDMIESAGIGEIIASRSERYAVGDKVMGGLGWCEGNVPHVHVSGIANYDGVNA